MGTAGDYIRRRAEEEVRKLLYAYVARSEQIGRVDTVGKQTADGNSVVLPNGEVVKVVKDGSPGQIDAVIKVSSDTYYMPSPYTRHVHVDGGETVWTVLGQYPADTNAEGIPTGFPVFNVTNLSSFTQYRVPTSMLPNVYTVQAFNSTNFVGNTAITDLGFNGGFAAALSPNAKTLVVVRVITQHTQIGSDADNSSFLHIFWNVITNFQLDSESSVITDGSVTGGFRTYSFSNSKKSLYVPSDTPDDVAGTFVGWEFENNINNIFADPCISFSGNTPTIDLLGSWNSQAFAGGYSNNGVSTSRQFSHRHTVAGLYSIRDLTGSNQVSYIDFEGFTDMRDSFGFAQVIPSGPGYITTGTIASFLSSWVYVNRHNYPFQIPDASVDQRNGLFKYGKDKTATAFKVEVSYEGGSRQSLRTDAYFVTNWDTLAETFPNGTPISDVYIGDGQRMYAALSNWLTRYNSGSVALGFLKATANGRFQEIQTDGLKIQQIQKWRYNSESTQIVVDGTVETSNDDLTVLGAEGSPYALYVMDFVVA